MRKFSPFIATVTDAAIITLANYVQAFSGYGGHHHGSPALAACQAAAPKSLKTNVWSTFKSSSSVSERHAVRKAKQNLAQQILAKNPSLIEYETALSQVQLKAIQDEDAIAQSVCGQLSAPESVAASTLYTNLKTIGKSCATFRLPTGQLGSGKSSADAFRNSVLILNHL
jgi:hypothetical protein